MHQVKISATVITYNEETNLRRCLESLQQVADEIVVVDSYSTDNTGEICRSLGVRFVQHAFEGHIQQKNFALDLVTHDNVLSLDADEVLSPELTQSILRVKADWRADAYRFNRLNNFCGHWIRHGLWYPDRKIRLWDRKLGRWGGVNPHDKVIMHEGARTKKLDGQLLHYTVKSLDEFYQQLDKFSSIQADGLKLQGFEPNFFHRYFKPLYKFLQSYLFRLGFLDGVAGYQIAKGLAWGIWERYRKLRE